MTTPPRQRGVLPALTAWACVALYSAGPAMAQRTQRGEARTVDQSFLQRQQVIEQRARDALDRELPVGGRMTLDIGGWSDNYIMLFDDGVISERTLRQYNLRLYGGITLDRGVHEGYARMRATYFDWNTGDSGTTDNDDLDGPNLERGWYRFNLRKAFQEYEKSDIPFDLKFKIGRDFVQIGTGYTIALTLDQIELVGEWLGFETTFITGTTPKSTDNIDTSIPVDGQSERDFFILQEKYKGFDHHQPFFYWATQRDRTEEDPNDWLQNYKYHSQYFGFGSTGDLMRNLRYSTEWVIERGTSYGDQRFMHTDDIQAWAFDQLLEYYFDHVSKPKVQLEYMFASGDQDRLGSPTNAAGGNRGDDTDNSFVGFGFRDTGLSLAPRLSNVHIWRVGGSFKPLPEVEALRDLELGTDWFFYAKHRSDGAISDPTADRASGFLGWEMDYFANYRITSDLAWTIRWGSFYPGDAYSDKGARNFLLSGLTWSF